VFHPARNGRGTGGSFQRKTEQHQSLAAGIAKFGMAAVRNALPYHDHRMPPELQRAEYAVSSNIRRTIHSTRHAVIDVRAMADWLQTQGYERIALCGTSLGSCYAYSASADDDRFEVCVYNHRSTHFGDVVWEGLSTQHIREGLEGNVSGDELRDLWSAIGTPAYFDKYASKKKSLSMYAAYARRFLRKCRGGRAQREGEGPQLQSGMPALRPLYRRRDAIQVHGRLSHHFVFETQSVIHP